MIPKETQLEIVGDYYFGFGDYTLSNLVRVEIALIPKKVSVKAWKTTLEKYNVSDEILVRRNMQETDGTASGDLYKQTRVRLLKESQYWPDIDANATLKTASGTTFKNRRYFDTAGYYFDVEFGKSFLLSTNFINELRISADLGFFSWDVQTPNINVQDDALMYGLKLHLKSKNVFWENTISGYKGWINRTVDYGHKPVVFASKISYNFSRLQVFGQYQNGITYFPYHQIRLGVNIPAEINAEIYILKIQ